MQFFIEEYKYGRYANLRIENWNSAEKKSSRLPNEFKFASSSNVAGENKDIPGNSLEPRIFICLGCGVHLTRSGEVVTPDRRIVIFKRNISMLGLKVLDYLIEFNKNIREKNI